MLCLAAFSTPPTSSVTPFPSSSNRNKGLFWDREGTVQDVLSASLGDEIDF